MRCPSQLTLNAYLFLASAQNNSAESTEGCRLLGLRMCVAYECCDRGSTFSTDTLLTSVGAVAVTPVLISWTLAV